MNKLSDSKRADIVRCLVDGASIRATVRMTGASKATVLKLLIELGEFCSVYQDHVLRNLPCTRVPADEIWAFVGAKQKNATQESQGDVWTFTALDADSKLMISWLVGNRSLQNATSFMKDVAARLANRVQLTADGHTIVERANLSMRMQMRRVTRLTNAFSKKAENHAHAVSLYFMYYNFCRAHTTLTKDHPMRYPTTPAMAAGVTDHVWKVEEILALMDPASLITT